MKYQGSLRRGDDINSIIGSVFVPKGATVNKGNRGHLMRQIIGQNIASTKNDFVHYRYCSGKAMFPHT